MKTFEDLTKAEREKVSIYLQYLNMLNINSVTVLMFGLTLFLVGYSLLFIFVIPSITIVGVMLTASGMLLAFTTVYGMFIEKKYLFLIFGYKNLYSDIFGVKKSDLKKVKIIKEIKWIRE